MHQLRDSVHEQQFFSLSWDTNTEHTFEVYQNTKSIRFKHLVKKIKNKNSHLIWHPNAPTYFIFAQL